MQYIDVIIICNDYLSGTKIEKTVFMFYIYSLYVIQKLFWDILNFFG